MITTFNGCYRSEIKVTPTNWNTVKASVKRNWRIHYRFYDPAFKNHPKYKKGKQVPIKGMNHVDTLEDRQDITRRLIDKEKHDIDTLGYNPITKTYMAPVEPETQADQNIELTPTTPFIQSLIIISKELGIEETTRSEMTSILKYFEESAVLLKKDQVALKDIKARDIKLIIENVKNLTVTTYKNKRIPGKGRRHFEMTVIDGKKVPVKVAVTRPKAWNDNEFNKHKKYLSMIYNELERQEIVEYNPIKKIPKRDTTPEDPDAAKAKVLTPEERRLIHVSLITQFPEYLRWLNIFYHSGARIKELMGVQCKYVDLEGQRFKVLVKKRKKKPALVWKTIKDAALPYWIELMKGCGPEDFIFSRGLKPGPTAIRPAQVGRRWSEHIKKKLGINKGQYKIKHLHTTEMINELEKLKTELATDAVKLAAEHNSHTSSAMVVNIYDVDSAKREHNKVKGLKNSFAG